MEVSKGPRNTSCACHRVQMRSLYCAVLSARHFAITIVGWLQDEQSDALSRTKLFQGIPKPILALPWTAQQKLRMPPRRQAQLMLRGPLSNCRVASR